MLFAQDVIKQRRLPGSKVPWFHLLGERSSWNQVIGMHLPVTMVIGTLMGLGSSAGSFALSFTSTSNGGSSSSISIIIRMRRETAKTPESIRRSFYLCRCRNQRGNSASSRTWSRTLAPAFRPRRPRFLQPQLPHAACRVCP